MQSQEASGQLLAALQATWRSLRFTPGAVVTGHSHYSGLCSAGALGRLLAPRDKEPRATSPLPSAIRPHSAADPTFGTSTYPGTSNRTTQERHQSPTRATFQTYVGCTGMALHTQDIPNLAKKVEERSFLEGLPPLRTSPRCADVQSDLVS